MREVVGQIMNSGPTARAAPPAEESSIEQRRTGAHNLTVPLTRTQVFLHIKSFARWN